MASTIREVFSRFASFGDTVPRLNSCRIHPESIEGVILYRPSRLTSPHGLKVKTTSYFLAAASGKCNLLRMEELVQQRPPAKTLLISAGD